MIGLLEKATAAAEKIRSKWPERPRVGIVLGTGLSGVAEQIQDAVKIPYEEIPHFPQPTVKFHSGTLVCGRLEGVPIAAMEGRFHYYEGYSMKEVTFPVRVFKALGAEYLFVTNAVGGMNPEYRLADIVVIDDHINLMGDNPLRGVNDDRLGPRFPDMSEPYDQRLIEITLKCAQELGIPCHRGVMVAVAGPNLETRAEYRMLRRLGADIVGMSTVPEVIVAAHAGLKTLGCSIVTDLCQPDRLEPVQIEKILKVAAEGGERLSQLLPKVVAQLA